jgi:hypothetical protein
MPFDPSTVMKKVQYITIDSEFVASSNTSVGGYTMGGNNNFSVNFGTSTYSVYTNNTFTNSTTYSSNIFIQEMRNVIGLKLVDFYVTQIATIEQVVGNTNPLAVKYIDVLCPDLPDQAQILDERKSKIFARIPLERDFSGSSNIVVNDKQWKSFTRQTNYFNPITIKQLNFQLWELTGQNTTVNLYGPGTYQPLQPDANFYMILEVTTIDYDAVTLPKEDPQVKVVEAIQSLENRFIELTENLPYMVQHRSPIPIIDKVLSPPKVQEGVQFDTKMYIIIALIGLLVVFRLSSR